MEHENKVVNLILLTNIHWVFMLPLTLYYPIELFFFLRNFFLPNPISKRDLSDLRLNFILLYSLVAALTTPFFPPQVISPLINFLKQNSDFIAKEIANISTENAVDIYSRMTAALLLLIVSPYMVGCVLYMVCDCLYQFLRELFNMSKQLCMTNLGRGNMGHSLTSNRATFLHHQAYPLVHPADDFEDGLTTSSESSDSENSQDHLIIPD